MNHKIKFKDTDGKDLGEVWQELIPRREESIVIDGKEYLVKDVFWVYSDPRKTYPKDPLSFKDVVLTLAPLF